MNKKLLLALFAITPFLGFAQDTIRLFDFSDRSNYILSGGYIGQQKTIDEGVSPLLYEGLNYGGMLGYRSEKMNRIWDMEASIGMSFQGSNAINDLGYFTTYNIDIATGYLWNPDPRQKLPFNVFAGINATYLMRMRFNEQLFNASFGYDVLTGIGLSGQLSKTLHLKGFEINLWRWQVKYLPHRVTFETAFDIPLGFVYLRPTYVVIENFVDGRTDPYDVESSKTTGIGRALLLNFNTGINYHLRNNNIIRFGYIWKYYKIDPGYSPVRGAQHLFQLIFKFKLNKTAHE
ncbi:MAG TPA: hypothetical protein VJ937_07560 [Salinivirga sp.]|uniref:hypothetical protein n=1 Tax=Salinivirga sp. TaxID=1970192 RepID=UPI002B49CE71|nr:hypothetical protein [Salinivirga sp.]HKK59319.1 hypothetical protein [Salinivirga sp.]